MAPEKVSEFLTAYQPSGTWAVLFRTSEDYLGTTLLAGVSAPDRYLSIDSWTSAEAYQAFRDSHAAAYEAIDRACEGFTIRETHIGSFEEVT